MNGANESWCRLPRWSTKWSTSIEPRQAGLAFSQFKYFSCRLARESRIIISVNILDAGLIPFNSKSKFKLSLHSLLLFFLSSPFIPIIFSRDDPVSRRENPRLLASKRKQRRVNDSRGRSDRLWVQGCRSSDRPRRGERVGDSGGEKGGFPVSRANRIRGIRPVFTIDRRIIIP